ncbi:MAG: CZB domain-containing protein, partial [Thermodesulfobacteriota bacterium]
MRQQPTTIGKKIGMGFGLVLVLLALLALVSILGIGNIVGNAEEVIGGNRINSELAQREVDHLNWVGRITGILLQGGGELAVETDPHKCGFGKWYYGEGRVQAEMLVPGIKASLDAIEAPHKQLHESAVAIKEALASGGATEALTVYTSKTQPALKSVQELLNKVREEARGQLLTDEAMLAAASRTRLLAGTLALFAIAAGVAISFLISKNTAKTLRGISLSLNEGAVQVAAAAGEVSSASQSLAEGASRQA